LLNEPVADARCGPANAGDFLTLCRTVRSQLPAGRYRHVLGVARMGERLARRYGVSRRKVRIAAMIHDIARAWSAQALLEFMAARGLTVSAEERRAPVLLHARIGAHLAREQFGVDDPEVLAAIAHHTIAQPGMSDVEKILYIADTIEPSRTFPGRAALEAAAFRSLDEGMLVCIKSSLEHLENSHVSAAAPTLALYEDLVARGEASA
jgi:predicted HD superfamily hydrolase involved in NAD metabolism